METKIKYELEFEFTSSPMLLYPLISTPNGLAEWFSNEVKAQGDFFTFIWDDSEEKARLASKKMNEKVKFKWLDENNKETDYYLEIRILEDEITQDISLLIIDFAYESDLKEVAKLWHNQIADLKHAVGSI